MATGSTAAPSGEAVRSMATGSASAGRDSGRSTTTATAEGEELGRGGRSMATTGDPGRLDGAEGGPHRLDVCRHRLVVIPALERAQMARGLRGYPPLPFRAS
jgi:hypothetical protein